MTSKLTCSRCGGPGAVVRTWCEECGAVATCTACDTAHKSEKLERRVKAAMAAGVR